MQVDAFKFYWPLAHRNPSSGVKLYPTTEYRDDCTDDSKLWYKTLMPDYSGPAFFRASSRRDTGSENTPLWL